MSRSPAVDHLVVTVRHWPVYGRDVRVVVDQAMYSDDDALTAWLEDQYGPGKLTSGSTANTYAYVRRVRGPAGMWRMFTALLNKSFN